MKIREIKTIQAEFNNNKVIAFYNEDSITENSIDIYWSLMNSSEKNFIIGVEIVRSFERDFQVHLQDTFIYNKILEQCENKMKYDDEEYESYLKVYEEILKELS
ncbi:MAG: hypothetical protein PWP67_527 [Clostridium butyricum]|nr:hypothetical protein [Clostridium butyricum]